MDPPRHRPDESEPARRIGTARGLPRTLALALAILVVATLVAVTHGPVLRTGALSLDDRAFIVVNPLVTSPSWSSTRQFFAEVLEPSTVKGYYLPLTMTSLMVDYALGGRPSDLRVFHCTSLVLHVLNTCLVLLVVFRLFGAVLPAAMAALIFGLHPLTVEPTAWVGERKTLLATFFAFGCVLAYIQHVRRGGRGWSTASVALFLLALLSKPTVAALPLLLLLLDIWPLRRFDVRAVVEKWPWLLLSVSSGVITLVSHQRTAGILPTDSHQWPLRAGYVLGFYLRKMVWPGELSCAYPSPAVFTLSDPPVLLACLAVILVTLAGGVLWRHTRALLVGWLIFVLAIVPTLGLVQYSWVVASDKYVYFPALGVLLVVACGLTVAWRSRPFTGTGARVVLLAALSLILVAEARGTRATIRHWSDTLTLYRQMERVAPASFIVQNELGHLLAEAAAPDEAITHMRRAIELWPDYADAHYNLGTVLASQGKIDEAIGHLRKADELNPDDPPTAVNLGMALRLKGRLDEAAAQFARAVRLNPSDANAHNELGGVLVLLGRNQEAVDHLQAALARAPGNARLHFRVASALLLLGGHSAEAADHLRQAIRLEPAWPAPYNALAWLLATSPEAAIRDGGESLRLASRAVELTGGRDPQVLDTMAAAQAASGRFTAAAQTERKAIDLAAGAADSLVRVMRVRLKSYERGIPHTEP